MNRRAVVTIVVAIVGVLSVGSILAVMLEPPRPRPGATAGERLWLTRCVHCHGVDGKGSWRAAVFLIRPGDLSEPAAMRDVSDRYIFDIIRSGGAPIGRPGMPGFDDLSDADVQALARYVRSLSQKR